MYMKKGSVHEKGCPSVRTPTGWSPQAQECPQVSRESALTQQEWRDSAWEHLCIIEGWYTVHSPQEVMSAWEHLWVCRVTTFSWSWKSPYRNKSGMFIRIAFSGEPTKFPGLVASLLILDACYQLLITLHTFQLVQSHILAGECHKNVTNNRFIKIPADFGRGECNQKNSPHTMLNSSCMKASWGSVLWLQQVVVGQWQAIFKLCNYFFIWKLGGSPPKMNKLGSLKFFLHVLCLTL